MPTFTEPEKDAIELFCANSTAETFSGGGGPGGGSARAAWVRFIPVYWLLLLFN